MKKILLYGLVALTVFSGVAQAQPKVSFDNVAPYRNEFRSYSIRDFAVKRDIKSEPYAIELKNFATTANIGTTTNTAVVEIPDVWLERELFLHTEGSRNSHRVFVNGELIGSARDSRLPSDFYISPAIKGGKNTITIEIMDDTGEPETGVTNDMRAPLEVVYIHSQQRVRVLDYDITAQLDSLGQYGLLELDITVINGYNSEEPIAVGFDLYSPEGDLKEYILREIVLEGDSSQTVHLQTEVWGAPKRLWSDESPKLYDVMIFVRRGKFYTEYIPVRVGFGETELTEKGIARNGKLIDIKPVSYNASSTQKDTEKEVAALKKRGFNTIYVDYPQPGWFYDVCDRVGIYVFDQANINTSRNAAGHALSNNPAWLDEYMGRTKGMYYRTRNHVCIIGRSLGGDSGNGFNMYSTYKWLKEQKPDQAVIYRFSGNQWNNDLELPAPSDR